ncbi:hypothetical protein GLOTRDRAFT_128123 [Gloeophyllum trabeum ATCC 11539]|uniref:LigT-like protein n=1 Tax=Gloeophyllum trabeum (strain ATCC 11539 / FP-39264 / Madison 617) TaxID=670483 RepID=S7Q9Z9_GLOTA|nr:uncharacterized protein GLOTRDRAFT_128123 [Gloeophyllum trabeum ATCC 11539]EPQ56173.1 hypothetical protein GLOTRDRAFT_128123 [Gloeophyllum trabeum ATCC 11539]
MYHRAHTAALEAIQGPLVLTLHISSPLQTCINDLRTTYFPAHRLLVPGHLTLFHALPSSQPSLSKILDDLRSVTERTSAFDIGLGMAFKMGQRGVAIDIGAGKSQLVAFRRRLRAMWKEQELTNQDRQTLSRPHFTIMNKETDAAKAEACFLELEARLNNAGEEEGMTKEGKALGVELWEYKPGGRWKFVRLFKFRE